MCGLTLTDINGQSRSANMHTYLCFVARDAGSHPLSLMGHGEQRCVCVSEKWVTT